MNDKFYSLPKEKRLNIINAGMEVFAQHDYIHASTDLIAAKAGISKGLLFYYFRNKKEFYMFLYDYLYGIMKEQVIDEEFLSITDFFELLEVAALRKVKILEKNPYIMDFAMRAFFSEKEAVSDSLKEMNTAIEEEIFEQYFSGIDRFKFKKDVAEPFKIYKMLLWMSDGYSHEMQMSGASMKPEVLKEEFDSWMRMFKKMLYKEEYQDE